MTPELMGCGHSANAVEAKTGKPVCVICVGIDPRATIVVNKPDLTGRKAHCAYQYQGNMHGIVDSNYDLAFFEYQPTKEYDEYYCGCRGWD